MKLLIVEDDRLLSNALARSLRDAYAVDQAFDGEEGLFYAAQDVYDLVVLDEINVAVDFGLLTADDVAAALDKKSEGTEVVLTGRNAPQEFIDRAALVTEMREVKHPYRDGVQARAGVEF